MVGKSANKLHIFRNEFRLSISDYMALYHFFSKCTTEKSLKILQGHSCACLSIYVFFFLLNKQPRLIRALEGNNNACILLKTTQCKIYLKKKKKKKTGI
jgi:hypothetical protein